jgi:hypothetical protein
MRSRRKYVSRPNSDDNSMYWLESPVYRVAGTQYSRIRCMMHERSETTIKPSTRHDRERNKTGVRQESIVVSPETSEDNNAYEIKIE